MSDVTVKELVGFKKAGDLGIELEVEGTEPLPVIEDDPWQSQGDESLRGFGMEYYTSRPITMDGTKQATIAKLITELLKNKGINHNSPRTSVHVHVNILNHTPVQLWTAVFTYWLLDNLLIKYCGPEKREGNLFCLTLKTAEGLLEYVKQDLRRPIPFECFRDDHLRYASQNLNAIRKFGSVEYRGMRGVVDTGIIDRWSTELYNIVHKSKQFKNPEDMLDTYQKIGTQDFLGRLLSREFVDQLRTYRGWEKAVQENAGLICELCYYHDWDKWMARVNKLAKDYGFLGRTTWGDPPRAPPHRINQPRENPIPRTGWNPAPQQPLPAGVGLRGAAPAYMIEEYVPAEANEPV